MAKRIISDPARVWAYVHKRTGVPATANMKGLGLEQDGELIAGVVYEGFTGHNIWMHVAAEPGARWMTREYLRYCFYYPFEECGVDRVSGWVENQNEAAKRFDEHLGFREEARLKGAARDGGDIILYVMWRKDCRYVDSQ